MCSCKPGMRPLPAMALNRPVSGIGNAAVVVELAIGLCYNIPTHGPVASSLMARGRTVCAAVVGTGTHNRPPAFCGLSGSVFANGRLQRRVDSSPRAVSACMSRDVQAPIGCGCTAVSRPWVPAPTTGHVLSAACRARWATGCLQRVVAYSRAYQLSNCSRVHMS